MVIRWSTGEACGESSIFLVRALERSLVRDLLQEFWTEMSTSVSARFPHSDWKVGGEAQAVLGGTNRSGA